MFLFKAGLKSGLFKFLCYNKEAKYTQPFEGRGRVIIDFGEDKGINKVR
jgi:hypothetical protein